MRRLISIAIVLLLAAPRVAWAQDDEDPDRPVFTHLTRIVEVVKEGEDTPLAGITVEAWGVPGGPLVQRTGQDGVARFEDMPRDDVVYVARAPGYVCGWHHPGRWWWSMPEEDADTDGDGVTRMQLELVPGSEVTGRVLTPEGEPVEGAEVAAYERARASDQWTLEGAPFWTARTDASGRFRTGESWPVPPRSGHPWAVEARVVATASGRIHEQMDILPDDVGKQEPLTFTLRPATEIRGVVRDAGGESVPNAIVYAYPPDHWAFAPDQRERRDTRNTHPREITVRTDADGAYELVEAVPGTSYFLLAERMELREEPWPSEFPAARSRVGAVTAPTRDDNSPATLDLALHELGTLVVRVAQDAGGDAKSVRIDVTPPQGARPWASDDHENGVLTVEEADAGAWTIDADAMGWLPAHVEVELSPGQKREFEVRLVRGAAISGTVVDDDGEPIFDAIIFAYSIDPTNPERTLDGREETHTDDDGRFTVSGLRPGPTQLFVRYGEQRSDGPSVVRAPASDVELLLTAEAVLRLHLRLPEGAAPPRSVRVTITRHSGRYPGTQTQESVTRGDGAYIVTHVPPGSATVAIEAPGFAPATRRLVVQPGIVNEPPPFVLSAGVSLRGSVVDGDGEPLANARILPWGNEERVAHTAADGSFELPHLASGLLEIAVSAPGMAERFVTVGVTELRPPVEITLTPGALVRGTVKSPGGESARVASLDFVPADARDGTTSRWRVLVEKDTFEIRLPPGRYGCDWVARAAAPDAPFVLEVDEGDDVQLDLIRE